MSNISVWLRGPLPTSCLTGRCACATCRWSALQSGGDKCSRGSRPTRSGSSATQRPDCCGSSSCLSCGDAGCRGRLSQHSMRAGHRLPQVDHLGAAHLWKQRAGCRGGRMQPLSCRRAGRDRRATEHWHWAALARGGCGSKAQFCIRWHLQMTLHSWGGDGVCLDGMTRQPLWSRCRPFPPWQRGPTLPLRGCWSATGRAEGAVLQLRGQPLSPDCAAQPGSGEGLATAGAPQRQGRRTALPAGPPGWAAAQRLLRQAGQLLWLQRPPA